MHDLPLRRIQCDEIWEFCYAKEKNVPAEHKGEFGFGDVIEQAVLGVASSHLVEVTMPESDRHGPPGGWTYAAPSSVYRSRIFDIALKAIEAHYRQRGFSVAYRRKDREDEQVASGNLVAKYPGTRRPVYLQDTVMMLSPPRPGSR
jgi:hypothetical protein